MNATVDEVLDICETEKIEADQHRGGVLEVAVSPAQLARLKEFHATEAAFGERDRELYGARETADRIRVTGAVGSSWTPHGARLHPVKLVKGLAEAVESLGVTIHESTPVTEIKPKHAITPYGTVRAPYVLRCTEGFTASLAGQRRTWLPMNSSMIATEPLTDAQWESIGWEGRETLGDMAHAYMYAQRTADGRIALGGRGVPYRYGSKTDNDGRTQPQTIEALRDILVRFFPQLMRHRRRPRLVGRPRRPPRLVRDGHARPLDGPGLGGRVRGLRRRHREPGGPYPPRPDPAGLGPVGPHGPHRTALGEPQGAQVGTGAAALARGPGDVRGVPGCGPPRTDGPQRGDGPGGGPGGQGDGPPLKDGRPGTKTWAKAAP